MSEASETSSQGVWDLILLGSYADIQQLDFTTKPPGPFKPLELLS